MAVLYRRTSDTQRKIISTKGDEVTTYDDPAKRALEVGLQQATECNERLWLHNRRMYDALKKVEAWLDTHDLEEIKPDWEARVRASLEDDEP